jgi:TolA-binding protein
MSSWLHAKLLSVVLTLGVAGGVAWHFARSSPSARASGPVQAAATEGRPATAPAAVGAKALAAPAAAASSDDQVGAVAVLGPKSAADRPRSSQAPAASAHLSEEVETLQRARKALASGSPDAALRELRAYSQRFPHGALASEETVLRVQALLARGENQKAVALADRFAAAHAESPLASRVQELVRAARGKLR